jgi:alpha-L-fucosidase
MAAKKMTYSQRMRWFHQARFGMFIHWGLYSLLGRGEWVMLRERVSRDEYARLADRFRPKEGAPGAWAALAAEAGMEYMVLTTRHHDGFCLFDSQVSDYTAAKTAAGRDLIAEYVRAVRKAGLKVGFYYSLLDWRFPGYWQHRRHRKSAEAMIAQAHDQVRELMTRYGRIDYLFYDGEWVPGIPMGRQMTEGQTARGPAGFWRSKQLNAMVRRLQPHIIINNRSGRPEDVDTPEQHVTASKPGRGWETCMTIGDSCGWGFIRHNPNMKTVPQLLQHLVTAAAGEGNFLLNVGPRPDGSIRREETDRLRAVGKWLARNGEAIYGSRRCELRGGMIGRWTRKGTTGYLHLFRYPGREAVVPLVATKVRSAELLATGRKLKVRQEHNGRLIISNLPPRPPHPAVNAIKVRFAGEPRALAEKDKAAWLTGRAR